MTSRDDVNISVYMEAVFRLFLIFAFFYFFDLASFPFSIDEELAAVRTDPSIWLSQGRWGAYLVELFLLPQPAKPFLPLAAFGVCASLAYCILLDLLGRKGRLTIQDYLGFGIFVAYPVWFLITAFYANMLPLGLGLLASAGATWCALHEQKRFPAGLYAGCSITLGAFAIGTYQSYVFVLAVMICGVMILRAQNNQVQRPWIESVSVGSLWLLAISGYFAVNSLFKLLPQPFDPYFQSLWTPGLLLSDPGAALARVASRMLGVYGVSDLYRYPLSGYLIVLLGVYVSLQNARNQNWSIFVFSVTALLVLIISPFTLALASGGQSPVRTLIGVPVAMWVFTALAFQARNIVVRAATITAVLVLLWQSLIIANGYQGIQYFSTRRDAQIAASLGEKILSLPNYNSKRSYYLIVYGLYNPDSDNNTIGGSFFGWGGGSPQRISAYMSQFGYPSFKVPAPELEARYLPVIAHMPVFPSPGSVALADDAILLRLSEEPSPQDLSIPGWTP